MLTQRFVYPGWVLTSDLMPQRAHPMVADAIIGVAPKKLIYLGVPEFGLSYNGSNPQPENVNFQTGRTFRNSGGSGGWAVNNPLYGTGATVLEYSVGILASGKYDGTRGRLVDQGTGSGVYTVQIGFDPSGVFYVWGIDTSNNISSITASTSYLNMESGFACVMTLRADKKARMYLRTRSGKKEYGEGSALAGTPTNLATNQQFSLLCNLDMPRQPNVWGGVSHFVVWPFALDDARAWQFADNPLGNFTGPRDRLSSGVAVASNTARSRGLIIQ